MHARSKKIISILSNMNLLNNCDKILKIETKIAQLFAKKGRKGWSLHTNFPVKKIPFIFYNW